MSEARSAILWVALLAVAAACSGGGGSSSSSSSGGPGPRQAQLTIVIPGPAAQSAAARRPAFISPSTQTLVITAMYGSASPAPGEAVDVGPGSQACVAGTGGSRTCTVAVAVQTGATALDIAARDAGNHLLAHALVTLPNVTDPIVDITVTLNGDPASVVLGLVGGEFAEGYAGSRTLNVTGLDADGNTIGLPGVYDEPIALSVSDDAISVSPTTILAPGDTATVTYNGTPDVNSVITASVIGSTGTTVTTAVVHVVGTGSPPPTMTPGPSPTPTPEPQVSAVIIINGRPRR